MADPQPRTRAPYGTQLRRHWPVRELHDARGARMPDELWNLCRAQAPHSELSQASWIRRAVAQYLAQPVRMPVRWTPPPPGLRAHPVRPVVLDRETRAAVRSRARRDRTTAGMVIGAAFAWAALSEHGRQRLAAAMRREQMRRRSG